MTESLSFQVEFGKFNTRAQKVSFGPGIHVVYGESGTGKSCFLKKLEEMKTDSKVNFKI